MKTRVSELVKNLGGAATVAAAIDVSAGAVRQWAHHGSIPRARWIDLIEAFPDRLNADVLRATEPQAAA